MGGGRGGERNSGTEWWGTTECKAWFTFFLRQILMLFRVTNCLNCVVIQEGDVNWRSLDWAGIHLIFIHIIEMNPEILDLNSARISPTIVWLAAFSPRPVIENLLAWTGYSLYNLKIWKSKRELWKIIINNYIH